MYTAAAAAKSLQSCPTLCNPIGDSPGKKNGVGVHFLLQCMKMKENIIIVYEASITIVLIKTVQKEKIPTQCHL